MKDIPELLTNWDDIVKSPVDVLCVVQNPLSILSQLHFILMDLYNIFS